MNDEHSSVVDNRDVIRRNIRESRQSNRTFWLMNALATIIACYGLLSNSPAVVIGAMVVAMLLGPIAGVTLGLSDGDRALLRTALSCLLGGMAWILLVAIVIGIVHRDAPLTEEIDRAHRNDLGTQRCDIRLFERFFLQ
jgi:uncharacterized membrane protein